jgi:hypothetical protein
MAAHQHIAVIRVGLPARFRLHSAARRRERFQRLSQPATFPFVPSYRNGRDGREAMRNAWNVKSLGVAGTLTYGAAAAAIAFIFALTFGVLEGPNDAGSPALGASTLVAESSP